MVIKFLMKLGNDPSEIESQLRKVYGDSALSYSTIKHLTAECKLGQEYIKDEFTYWATIKTLSTLFSDAEVWLLTDFLENGTAITVLYYAKI